MKIEHVPIPVFLLSALRPERRCQRMGSHWDREVIKSCPQGLVSNAGIDVKGLSTDMYVLEIKRANGIQSTHKIIVKK